MILVIRRWANPFKISSSSSMRRARKVSAKSWLKTILNISFVQTVLLPLITWRDVLGTLRSTYEKEK